jgi:hypothetical protein
MNNVCPAFANFDPRLRVYFEIGVAAEGTLSQSRRDAFGDDRAVTSGSRNRPTSRSYARRWRSPAEPYSGINRLDEWGDATLTRAGGAGTKEKAAAKGTTPSAFSGVFWMIRRFTSAQIVPAIAGNSGDRILIFFPATKFVA